MISLKKVFPEIITIGIIVIGALCYPLIARGLQYSPPLLFAAIRVLIAGASIMLVLPVLKKPIFPPRGTWKWVMLFALLSVVITYGAMFASHEGTASTTIPILESLQPFFAILLAIVFLREKLSPATCIVLIFGTVGIVLMSVSAFAEVIVINYQMTLLALLASVSAAVASIIAKGIKRPGAIVTISAWQFIVGSIPLFLFSWLFEQGMPVQFNLTLLSTLAFLAIIGTAATTVIWYVLVQKTDISRLSVLFFLAPAFALLIAKVFNAIPVGGWELAGIAMIIGGVVIGFKKRALPVVS